MNSYARRVFKNSFITFTRFTSPLFYGLFLAKKQVWRDSRVPILMYHKISNLTDDVEDMWNVPPTLFREHMDYIARNRFHVLSLLEFYDYMTSGKDMPENSVVITFDDGYEGVYRHAFPLLKEYKFPATIFLACDLDTHPIFWWDEPLIKKRPHLREEVLPLSWEQIDEMKRSGYISFGSHTMSHPHLGRLPAEDIEYELGQSKKLLEEKLNEDIIFFAYPFGIRQYGDISDETARMVVEKGYKLACTSEIGRNKVGEDVFMLKRIGISHFDNLSSFRTKLVGAYDWVVVAQKTFQHMFKNKH